MMRRHARSENSKIIGRLRSAPAPEGSGSRVFPLRAVPSASMPALRSRKQSTVVVAKAVGKAGGSDVCRMSPRAKAFRPGKRLQALSQPHGKPVGGEDDWARVFGGSEADRMNVSVGDSASNRCNGPSTLETDAAGIAPLHEDSFMSNLSKNSSTTNKRFGMVYSRKRLRSELSHGEESVFSAVPVAGDLLSSQRFVNTYTRRKKLKVATLSEVKYLHQFGYRPAVKGKPKYGREVMISDSSWNLAKCVEISEDDVLTSLVGRMMLVVLVDSSCSKNSIPLSCILSFVRSWMSRSRFRLWELTAHLLSGSLENVSPEHGVHLLPLRWMNNLVLPRNSQHSCGLCKIYDARQSGPLLYIDFLALPSYFKWLHTTMLLGSLYLPCTLSKYLRCLCLSLQGTVKSENDGFQVSVEKTSVSESPLKRKQPWDVIIALESVVRDRKYLSCSQLQQLRRKRSSSRRQTKSWYPSLASPHAVGVIQGNAGTVSESKMTAMSDLFVEPLHLEVPETSDDFMIYKDESDVSTPVGSHEKCRKLARKSPVDPVKEKEFRTAMTELKQNILSARCKANVLVTVADRCWREEGFEVSLDVSTSQGWSIAVKSQGTLRYLHKPQDIKPCVVNRFTHAYMWQGEDGWKLEFPDRWDWSVFKEMHLECRDHNIPEAPSRAIPVPGVREVSGYEDYISSSFVRPDEYIRMPLDEVHRSLESEVLYDMDSADDDWLKKFNSIHVMASGSTSITEEEFEKIIFTFEKCAYNSLTDIFDKESVLELYQDFGNADALFSIYDYWIKKRSKRRAALMRVFQGPRLQKPLVHNTHLRKKRSFKKQRSQSYRTKHEAASEDICVDQKALQRIQDAESAAKRATETAIQFRNRAQMLVKHAELAVYKSVRALRIAEAFQASESPNVASVLD